MTVGFRLTRCLVAGKAVKDRCSNNTIPRAVKIARTMPDAVPRRKALMLCYYYPPVATSGVVRSVGFARMLSRFGWEPLILTVKDARDVNVHRGADIPDGIEVVRTREFNLAGLIEFMQGAGNRLLRVFGSELRDRFFRETIAIPDSQIAWASWPRGIRLARRCAVVYASCSPFSSAVSACLIKRATGRPLVVDFRDAWTLNPHAHHLAFHQRVIEALERRVFAVADRIILNTDGAAALYARRYPACAPKMTVIPNGYDRLNAAESQEPVREPFRIVHVGAFYGSRTPDQLLDVLDRFEGNTEFVQIGSSHPSLQSRRSAKVRVIPQMKHADALALMRTASLLYLRQGWEAGVTDYIAVAAKSYEYLATGLPILAHCPPGDNADLVRRHAAHSYLVTSPEGSELEDAVRAAYENRFTFSPHVSPEFARTFDRAALTQRLAQVFDEVSGRAANRQ
jgi:glycosyltransferase involved in cell wall biosynthesis